MGTLSKEQYLQDVRREEPDGPKGEAYAQRESTFTAHSNQRRKMHAAHRNSG